MNIIMERQSAPLSVQLNDFDFKDLQHTKKITVSKLKINQKISILGFET